MNSQRSFDAFNYLCPSGYDFDYDLICRIRLIHTPHRSPKILSKNLQTKGYFGEILVNFLYFSVCVSKAFVLPLTLIWIVDFDSMWDYFKIWFCFWSHTGSYIHDHPIYYESVFYLIFDHWFLYEFVLIRCDKIALDFRKTPIKRLFGGLIWFITIFNYIHYNLPSVITIC